MEEDICNVISLLDFSAEHALEKIDARFTYLIPSLSFVRYFFGQYFSFYSFDIRTCKWHLATEKLIHNDTEAPNIASKVAWLLQDDLRRLVSKCTCLLLEALVVLEEASQTKVSDFDFWILASTAQEDVLVLNVAVHDLFQVDIL